MIKVTHKLSLLETRVRYANYLGENGIKLAGVLCIK